MRAKNLSKTEIDAIKIVLAILEAHDTLDFVSRYTKLPKSRTQYLLSALEKAGLIYKKEGTKRWRVRVDYFRVWKNAEYVYYLEKEKATNEQE